MPDAHKNFAYSTVATAPSPDVSGTSLVVAAGEGTRFPATPFNAVIWATRERPLPNNAEVVRVTVVSTDTFTITRAQEGSSARAVVVGDQIAASVTALTLTDAETGAWTVVTKTGDESVSSSTVVQNDDELFFTAVSTAQYEFELVIIYGSPAGGATPDLKIDLGEDATARGNGTGVGLTTADASNSVAVLTNQTATMTFGTATANRIAKVTGVHQGNGGTFRLRWAQNTSGGNATIVRAGSVLRYRRVV